MNRQALVGTTLVILVAGAIAIRVPAADAVYPVGLATSADGPVYIADLNLPGILKWDGGELTVHFQAPKQFRTPLNRVRCLTLDSQGRLFAGCTGARNVFRIEAGSEPAPVSPGLIEMPMSLAVNAAGELYVADLELRCIWKVAPGGQPEKFADVPPPRGIFLDKSARLWVVSTVADQVIRLSPNGKARESIVTGTPFTFPHNIVVDDDETAYVTDGYGHAVWKIVPGKEPKIFASGPPLDNPVGIALRGKQLLVVDPRAKALVEIDADGKMNPIYLTPRK